MILDEILGTKQNAGGSMKKLELLLILHAILRDYINLSLGS